MISSREVSVRIRSHRSPEPERFVYVKQGGNITLECEDCRGPVCHAARDGAWSRGSRVTLVRLDRGDSGEYSCRVADRRVSISLVVQHPPEIMTKYIIIKKENTLNILFLFSVTSVSGELGGSAKLQCHVTGLPVPMVSWLDSAGHTIRSSSKHSIEISDFSDGKVTSSLNLYNLSKADMGSYTCLSSNSLGM